MSRTTVTRCAAVAPLVIENRYGELGSCDSPDDSRCELSEAHQDDHARLLWYHDPHGAVWLRWNENGGLLSPRLSWCSEHQPGADDNACVLFAGHPAPHSWDVVDPLMHARAAKVAAQLGLPFD